MNIIEEFNKKFPKEIDETQSIRWKSWRMALPKEKIIDDFKIEHSIIEAHIKEYHTRILLHNILHNSIIETNNNSLQVIIAMSDNC